MRQLSSSRPTLLFVLLLIALIAACSRSGPVRRISEPAASIQQLTVGTDGQWALQLRMQNFSSIPMRFGKISLAVRIGEHDAGRLESTAMLTVSPESADVLTINMQPSSNARISLANAFAGGRGVAYRIDGILEAGPHDRDKSRSYDVRHHSTLNPVPGLPGVLR